MKEQHYHIIAQLVDDEDLREDILHATTCGWDELACRYKAIYRNGISTADLLEHFAAESIDTAIFKEVWTDGTFSIWSNADSTELLYTEKSLV